MIREGLFTLLSTDSGVSALVGSRIFAGDAPDDFAQYPCIAYSFVGGNAGGTFKTSGMIRQRVQIDAFAAQPVGSSTPGTVADQIRSAVIKAVNGWQQVLSDGTNVSNAVLLNPGTDFVSEQRISRCMVEFYILYTLPTA